MLLGLALGLRFLHFQLEFSHLAEVRIRFLAPKFVRSCSPCAAPNLIFSERFTPRPSHFAKQTFLCPPISSPLAGKWPLLIFLFLFSYFSFTQPAPLVFKSKDILFSSLGSGFQHLPSPLSLPTP